MSQELLLKNKENDVYFTSAQLMIMEKLNSKVNLLPMFPPYMRLKFLSELRDNIDFKNVNIIENLSLFVCMG